MKMNELIKKLGRYIGVHPLRVNQHKICSLVFDDTVTLHMQPDSAERFVHLYSVVGILPEDSSQGPIFETLLEANLFGSFTDNAYFSVYEKKVFLNKQVPLGNLDFYSFVKTLEYFIHHCETWMRLLKPEEKAPIASVHPHNIRDHLDGEHFEARLHALTI